MSTTPDELELAYVAGFFDGEGSVTIHNNGRKLSPRGMAPNHTLQVSLGNTEPVIVRRLHEVWGGSLTFRTGRGNCRPVWQWTIKCAKALPFLEAIMPFVRVKCRQLEIAISYQKTKKMKGAKRVSATEILWREEQRRLIRELNGRYHLNGGAVVCDVTA